MDLNPFQYHAPQSLKEAADLYFKLSQVKLLAGGTMLLNSLKTAKKKGLKTPQHIISLKRIPELKDIRREEGGLSIGAMTTFADLIRSPLVSQELRNILRQIGTTQIRNMGTAGGNLTCRYTWTELGTVMMSLNALLSFYNPKGESYTETAAEFFAKQAKTKDILTHIRVPGPEPRAVGYYRLPKTSPLDVPLFAVCISAECAKGTFQDTVITINRGTSFPCRYRELEAQLNGKTMTPETISEMYPLIQPQAFDPHCEGYKGHMYKIGIRDTLKNLIKGHRDHG